MDIQQDIESLKTKEQIVEKIKFFTLYTEDDNVVRRRAGLYGISVIAVALYQTYQKVNNKLNTILLSPLK
jgi:hypothetical protein